jgi:hypothetical protein
MGISPADATEPGHALTRQGHDNLFFFPIRIIVPIPSAASTRGSGNGEPFGVAVFHGVICVVTEVLFRVTSTVSVGARWVARVSTGVVTAGVVVTVTVEVVVVFVVVTLAVAVTLTLVVAVAVAVVLVVVTVAVTLAVGVAVTVVFAVGVVAGFVVVVTVVVTFAVDVAVVSRAISEVVAVTGFDSETESVLLTAVPAMIAPLLSISRAERSVKVPDESGAFPSRVTWRDTSSLSE